MFLCDAIEAEWVRWIERNNAKVRSSDALREHLFGGERANVRVVVERLLDLQSGVSFYGTRRLTREQSHVDHFIPWSLSRHDAVGNLVLCSAAENLRWSDQLKPPSIRAKWERRNEEHAMALKECADACGLRWDAQGTREVARWAYGG